MTERKLKSELNEFGAEIPDPVPKAPALGFRKEPTLHERIRDMVRGEHLRLAALQAGAETFDEADDMDVGDDFDPQSPFEEVFDPVDHNVREQLRQDEFREKFEARMAELSSKRQKPADKVAGEAGGSQTTPPAPPAKPPVEN